jgi:hypothetical protein
MRSLVLIFLLLGIAPAAEQDSTIRLRPDVFGGYRGYDDHTGDQ